MNTLIDEIYETVLPEMRIHEIADTTENRLTFLMGVQQAWQEDASDSLEKILYQRALNSEIFRLQMQIMIPTD